MNNIYDEFRIAVIEATYGKDEKNPFRAYAFKVNHPITLDRVLFALGNKVKTGRPRNGFQSLLLLDDSIVCAWKTTKEDKHFVTTHEDQPEKTLQAILTLLKK